MGWPYPREVSSNPVDLEIQHSPVLKGRWATGNTGPPDWEDGTRERGRRSGGAVGEAGERSVRLVVCTEGSDRRADGELS